MDKRIKDKILRVSLTTLKIIWIPAVLITALAIGLYIGYGYITKDPGSNVFNMETWRAFFDQIRSLR